jgi:hypothetical protein
MFRDPRVKQTFAGQRKNYLKIVLRRARGQDPRIGSLHAAPPSGAMHKGRHLGQP